MDFPTGNIDEQDFFNSLRLNFLHWYKEERRFQFYVSGLNTGEWSVSGHIQFKKPVLQRSARETFGDRLKKCIEDKNLSLNVAEIMKHLKCERANPPTELELDGGSHFWKVELPAASSSRDQV